MCRTSPWLKIYQKLEKFKIGGENMLWPGICVVNPFFMKFPKSPKSPKFAKNRQKSGFSEGCQNRHFDVFRYPESPFSRKLCDQKRVFLKNRKFAKNHQKKGKKNSEGRGLPRIFLLQNSAKNG